MHQHLNNKKIKSLLMLVEQPLFGSNTNNMLTNNQSSNYPSWSVKDHLPAPLNHYPPPNTSQTGYHQIVSHII